MKNNTSCAVETAPREAQEVPILLVAQQIEITQFNNDRQSTNNISVKMK